MKPCKQRSARALLALFVAGAAFSNTSGAAEGDDEIRVCATPEPPAEIVARTAQESRPFMSQSSALRVERVVVTVPIAFHVLHDGNDGNVLDSQIAAQLAVLNQAFQPLGVRFIRHSITRTDDAQWQNALEASQEQAAARRKLSVNARRALNLYIGRPRYRDSNGSIQGALGIATFPWYVDQPAWDQRLDGVIVKDTTLPGGTSQRYNLGYTAVHEVGHWLGLLHTFQGGGAFSLTNDGCQPPGDEVPDTPYERGEYVGPGLRAQCPVQLVTVCAQGGFIATQNFMNYSDDRCMTEFTVGQDLRVKSLFQRYRPELLHASPDVMLFFKNRPLN